mmetsp:Transcript_7178/g.13195  ORF Transcript_7178/g.13195 Transcript_7178/m.13195 type:complete len:115 (-) Transcript_7178:200-544(-)
MNGIENRDSKPKANTCSKRDIATQTPIKWLAGFSDAARGGTTPQTKRTLKSEPNSKRKTGNRSKRNCILTKRRLNVTAENKASPDVNKVNVGSRLAVYKADHDHYQEAVVTQRL